MRWDPWLIWKPASRLWMMRFVVRGHRAFVRVYFMLGNLLFAVISLHKLFFEVLNMVFYHFPAIFKVRTMRISVRTNLLTLLHKARLAIQNIKIALCGVQVRLIAASCWSLVIYSWWRHGVFRKSEGTVVCVFKFFLPQLLSSLLFLKTLLLLVLSLVLVKHVLNCKRGLVRKLFVFMSLSMSISWFLLWAGNTRFNHRVLCRDILLWWRGMIIPCYIIEHGTYCGLFFGLGVICLFECIEHFLGVVQ